MDNVITLSKATIGGMVQDTCTGREIQRRLGNNEAPTTWAKKQVKTGGLVEGLDYCLVLCHQNGNLETISNLQRPTHEYHFTVESTKSICMMSRTPTGRLIRDYFIECERQLKAVKPKTAMELVTEATILLAADVEVLKGDVQALKARNKVHDLENAKFAIQAMLDDAKASSYFFNPALVASPFGGN